MEMFDCKVVITYKELYAMYVFNWERIYSYCPCYIPPTLERYVERHVITELQGVKQAKIMENISFYRSKYYALQPRCLYKNLVYYEKSFSSNANMYIQSFIEKVKQLPKLKTLNFTHAGLTAIPYSLYKLRWSAIFPNLSFIDVSYNDIRVIPFRYSSPNGVKFKVDMSYNNITVLDKKQISRIKGISPSFVNVSNNPFICNCELKDMLNFIRNDVGTVHPAYSYLKNIKCNLPLLYNGMNIGQMSVDKLCQYNYAETEKQY